MFYEKKYPLTHLPGEFVLLSWERGYKETKLFYNERELISVNSIQKLKKGISFFDEVLGEIRLKFSEKPMSIDVIVNDFHSPINNTHPEKKIRSISNYFYIFAIFTLVAYLFSLIGQKDPLTLIIVSIEEIVFIIIYTVCAYFSSKSKIWAVYTGFISYSFVTLIVFLMIIASVLTNFSILSPFMIIMSIVFRTTFTIFMIPYIKMAISLKKHRHFNGTDSSILDQNILA